MAAHTHSKRLELKSAIIEEKKRQVMQQLDLIAIDLRYYALRDRAPERFDPAGPDESTRITGLASPVPA